MTRSWQKIDDFKTLGEFDRFVSFVNEQATTGAAKEVPVTALYLEAATFTERWFQNLSDGLVWRLIWPDGPFTGLFEPVDDL